jgi:hypothetical protein
MQLKCIYALDSYEESIYELVSNNDSDCTQDSNDQIIRRVNMQLTVLFGLNNQQQQLKLIPSLIKYSCLARA